MPLLDMGLMHLHDRVQPHLDPLLEAGPRALVVDMSGLGRLSSTTIAALLWVNRRCTARGVDVRLRGSSRQSVETLRRIGLLSTLPLETTLAGDCELRGSVTPLPPPS